MEKRLPHGSRFSIGRRAPCMSRGFVLQLSFHEIHPLIRLSGARSCGLLYFVMVRKHAWFRALVAVWGLWFTAALSEAAGLHTCAMHGNHAVAQAHSGHAAAEHSGHGAPSHASKACTCLGFCCAASVATPRVSIQPAVVSIQRETAVFSPAGATLSITRAHALPFANGPPTAI